jgi:hypothetical protein
MDQKHAYCQLGYTQFGAIMRLWGQISSVPLTHKIQGQTGSPAEEGEGGIQSEQQLLQYNYLQSSSAYKSNN